MISTGFVILFSYMKMKYIYQFPPLYPLLMPSSPPATHPWTRPVLFTGLHLLMCMLIVGGGFDYQEVGPISCKILIPKTCLERSQYRDWV
jgi:hypothetical protein